MKRLAFVIAALILFSYPALAAPVHWQGEFVITGKSGSCPDYDPTNTFGRVRFRPGIGGDNGTSSMFSVFTSRGTSSYYLSGHLFDTTFRAVSASMVGDGVSTIFNPVKVKFSYQKPAVISASTDFLNIRGQISGFDFMPLCTVGFKMVLYRRAD